MRSIEQPELLIVNDETQVRGALRTSLQASGFEVCETSSRYDALKRIRENELDLVLLDVSARTVDGLDLCREIRGLGSRIGIIVVTCRDSEKDTVEALEAGADDYVIRPFRMRELTARCHAVLRRAVDDSEGEECCITAGDLELNLRSRVLCKAGKVVRLTPTEYSLLAFMMKNQEVPLTHTKLLRAVWGPEYGAELEYLRTYVRLLRRKIEHDPAQPQYLLTEPFLGYRFSRPPTPRPTLSAIDHL